MSDDRLESEKVIVQAPMSFTGSAARIWRITRIGPLPVRILLGVLAVVLIFIAWVYVLAWYLIFGLLLVPYRLVRRGSRKRKQDRLRHREMLDAIDKQSAATDSGVLDNSELNDS